MTRGISITRHTAASYAPIPIYIETDVGAWQLMLDGPMRNFRVPGCRLRHFHMEGSEFFDVNIVTEHGDYPYHYRHRHDFHRMGDVQAITISDGFMWAPQVAELACTYRPAYVHDGAVYESGITSLIKCPPMPYPPYGPYY